MAESRSALASLGFLLLPLTGGFAFIFGPTAFQLGYFAVLACGLAYFVEDLLMRKIRIDDNILYFGFRQYKLGNLASIGLKYASNRMIPKVLSSILAKASIWNST